MKNEYADPYNSLETYSGIMPKDGTWVIMKKPHYYVWKARIEYSDDSIEQEEFCSFHHAVGFIRKNILTQQKCGWRLK